MAKNNEPVNISDSESFIKQMSTISKKLLNLNKRINSVNTALGTNAEKFNSVQTSINNSIDSIDKAITKISSLKNAYPNKELKDFDEIIDNLVSKKDLLISFSNALNSIGNFRFNRTSIESLSSFIKELGNIKVKENTVELVDTLTKLNKGINSIVNTDIDKLSDNITKLMLAVDDLNNEAENFNFDTLVNSFDNPKFKESVTEISEVFIKLNKSINTLANANVKKLKSTLEDLILILDDLNTEAKKFNFETITNALDNSIGSIKEYTESITNLNKELKNLANISSEIKKARLDRVTINVNNKTPKETPKEKQAEDPAEDPADASKKKFKHINDIFRTSSSLAKAAKTGNISAAADSAAKLTTILGSKMVLASAGLAASLVALTKITVNASKETETYSRYLQQMGIELNSLERASLNKANNLNKLSNQVGNAFQSLGEAFEPVLNVIISGTESLLNLMGANSDEIKSKKLGVKSSISNKAGQSGFSLSSSNALGEGTYNAAKNISAKYGMQGKESEIAKALGDAWLNGSDAAKDYGVVLNDNVLTGYMATKGVDIANVEITDAMKQYYRYQLMLEQTSNSNKSNMQDMIKQWTQLGFIIDKTKGKLFSFDEVIQLTAVDSRIPDVLGGSLGNGKDDIYNAGSTGNKNSNITDNSNIKDNSNEELVNNTQAIENLTQAIENNGLIQNIGEQVASQNNLIAAQTNLAASQNSIVASQTNVSAVQMFSAVSSNFINQLVIAGQEVSNAIQSATSSGISAISSATVQGVQTVSAVASNQASSIVSLSTYQKSSINAVANQGKTDISQSVNNGVNNINQTSNSNQNNINKTGNYWVNRIASVGSALANAVGLGGHVRAANTIINGTKTIANSAKTGYSKNGIKGAIAGSAKGTASAAKASATAMMNPLNPLDWITEGADLLTSLKNEDTGKYEWNKLPSATLNMAKSSIINPIQAFTTGASYGFRKTKENGLGLLAPLGAVTGGISNAATYAALETLSDYGPNMLELTQDVIIGGYNRLTGNNITGNEGLHKFNNNTDVLLNDLVTGSRDSYFWEWASTPAFANGGIGTKEIHGATLFENNKKEAIIPLESPDGIRYLSDALKEAGLGNSSGSVTVNVNMRGLDIRNQAEVERFANQVAEVIEVQVQRRGELSYGSKFKY